MDRISELKSEIDLYIDRLGAEKMTEILMERFALSDNQASSFLDLIDNMIPDVSYEAIPEDWFFDVRVHRVGDTYSVSQKDGSKRGGPIRCKSLKKFAKDIREERDIIRDTIQLTWKLSDEKRHSVIEKWQDEYHDHLNKIPVTLPGDELKVLSATEIANRVVAKRYSSKESSIETYAKLGST
ncbi:hypothetical protein DSCA_18570 [Desulfosarcina alkanivorans]|uniref:Uncharacterized protein n=2 Tax=Desulfosarcina alkanivorans TaxID=571177 RepID=A0A5K7YTG1_9BACT|nr:hypothetical protein DSCA_18570 [Desulfosarcina alkanivorans]